VALVTVVELLLKLPLMHPQQLRRKAKRRPSSSFTRRASSPSISYLQTRIRGSRLLNAARLLVLIELTHRLHQAYRFAYDKQAADWLLPRKSIGLGRPTVTMQPAGTTLSKPTIGKVARCEQLTLTQPTRRQAIAGVVALGARWSR